MWRSQSFSGLSGIGMRADAFTSKSTMSILNLSTYFKEKLSLSGMENYVYFILYYFKLLLISILSCNLKFLFYVLIGLLPLVNETFLFALLDFFRLVSCSLHNKLGYWIIQLHIKYTKLEFSAWILFFASVY